MDLAKHLVPLAEAIKHGCVVVLVGQGKTPFGRDPRYPERPHIFHIGDDLWECHGPEGFDGPSLDAMFASITTLGIMVAEPQAKDYAAVATSSVLLHEDSCIIECRSEHEADWLTYAQAHAPRPLAILVRTVRPEGTA